MWWLLFIRNAHVIYILYNIDAAKVASSMVERGEIYTPWNFMW